MLVRTKRTSRTVRPCQTRSMRDDCASDISAVDVVKKIKMVRTQMNGFRMQVWAVFDAAQALDVGPAMAML